MASAIASRTAVAAATVGYVPWHATKAPVSYHHPPSSGPPEGAVDEVFVEVERTGRLRVLAGRALVEVDECADIVGVDGRALAVGARADEAVQDFAHVGVSFHGGGGTLSMPVPFTLAKRASPSAGPR